ncbi:CGNR zinc finger domain-containing protein [Micromonospora andamanensis]|uniref:CGNR zinc finger domain-containing protein n=1 Tax=Micromonospora andamanensis TaxID=1287068 RepID=UPI0035710D0D
MWGLATWSCERGFDRLGVCPEDGCQAVFLDEGSSRRRQFCSDRCGTRSHVRAYRARRRAASLTAAGQLSRAGGPAR